MNIFFLLERIILQGIDIYRLLLIVYFFLSWIPQARGSQFEQILAQLCEPYVGFFRQFIPPIGFISFAGLISLIALSFIQMGVSAIFDFLYVLFI